MDKILIKRLLLRFTRAFIAGFSGAVAVVVFAPNSWADLPSSLSALAFAGVVGGITGLVQAVGLYFRNA